jgi:sugar-specific transcriptional regulator TrmB
LIKKKKKKEIMKEEALRRAGLSKNEQGVYLALLELGPSRATTIVKKSKMHRANVYDALERLGIKGLVSISEQEKVHHYEAATPERLLQIIKEQKEEIKKSQQLVSEVLPELQLLQQLSATEGQSVTLYKGREGLKTVLEDVLSIAKNNDFYIIGYTGIASRTVGSYHLQWEKRRIKKGIKRKTVATEENRKLLSTSPLTQVRYLPGEYSSPASTSIYADRVVIHLMEDKEPVAIMIKSQGMAKAYKKYFALLWSISRK